MNVQLGPNQPTLTLLPEKAFYWPEQQILGLSDVHLGKAESLQRAGINIPNKEHHRDLDRIERLIADHHPRQVLILGDWIHQAKAWTPALHRETAQFMLRHPHVRFRLLLGNHDRGCRPMLADLPIEMIDGDLEIAPFAFSHGHAPANSQMFQIQGHVHPVVQLRQGSTRLRLPCFAVKDNVLTVPSFGGLTGGYEIQPADYDKVFVCAPGEVFQARVPRPGASSMRSEK